jgi:hypothetical protein
VVFILFGRWLSIQMHVILLEVGHPAGVITEIQSAIAKFNQNYMKGTRAGLPDLGIAFAALSSDHLGCRCFHH